MNRTTVNFSSITPEKPVEKNLTTPSNPGKKIRMATFSDDTTPNPPAALYYNRTATTPTSLEESAARVSQSIHDRFSMSIRNI